jgi:RNA polymerase sigma factor FliA
MDFVSPRDGTLPQRSRGDLMRLGPTAEQPADRDALVLQHVSLVKAVAQRLAHRLPAQVEISDLVGVGVLGLIDAATRYKPSTGVPFDAFARRRVQGAMLDALRDLDWAPRSLRKMRRDLDTAISQLRHKLRREPEDVEIAEAMNLSEIEYERLLDRVKSLELGVLRHLDAANSDGVSLLELAIDPEEGPEARLERTELHEHLARALMELPDRERQILALYYEEELTMAEIGAVIGVCESRVSQLRSLSLARLRASLRESLADKIGIDRSQRNAA